MTDQELTERIDEAIAAEFELDRETMTPDATLYQALGLDSLDAVDMVILLEKTFKFKIQDEEAIRKITTLGDLHRFVIGKIREREATQG